MQFLNGVLTITEGFLYSEPYRFKSMDQMKCFFYRVKRNVGIMKGSQDDNSRMISDLKRLSEECLMSEMNTSLSK